MKDLRQILAFIVCATFLSVSFATTYTDDFNRTDSGTLGANWTEIPQGASIGIVSNAAKVTDSGSVSAAYYIGTFSNDQFSQATVVATLASNQEHGVLVRASGSSYATSTYYMFVVSSVTDKYAAGCSGKIVRNNSGTETSIANVTMSPIATNDVIKLQVVGTTLTAYVNGSQVYSGTNSSISSGAAGIGGWIDVGTGMSWDTWSGGDVSSATIVPIVVSEMLH